MTLKIADSSHKDALLADRKFFAAMHSARGMQITQNLVTRLSESSLLSMNLLKQDGTTKTVYILTIQTADRDFAELYKVIKENCAHRAGSL